MPSRCCSAGWRRATILISYVSALGLGLFLTDL
ncbi:Putative RND superfamily drug exporter [Thermobacillus xylanilyticus]|uniref:RND superfamily drug exporter n=2 Tax=Thermobacillus TaxID=76632 RepID=A0ABM8V5L7_THEXY|nr:Putative RND superfamily drug exporter [Thermobacillus xylanilyticus]